MTLKLSELEAREKAATPGPMTNDAVCSDFETDIVLDYHVEGFGHPVLVATVFDDRDHDRKSVGKAIALAKFFAHARTDLPALIDWAKRARPWIQKSYSQQVKEREVIEDLYGAQEPYISGLADDIAELEQLLGEVE